jgi:lysyl oxidase
MRKRLATFIVLSGLFLPAHAPAADVIHLGTLAIDAGIVWDGPFVREASVFWELCDVQGPCFKYSFDVASAASRLRVAIDFPEGGNDQWAVAIFPPGEDPSPLEWNPVPDGSDGSIDRADLTDYNTREFTMSAPAQGRWNVTVVPVSVTAAAFRMRAILQSAPTPPAGKVLLPPNLRAHPPLEPTFSAPARQVRWPYLAGVPAPPVQAPLEVGGRAPFSCTFDEMALEGAERCLRVSVGVENIGAGPLDLRLAPLDSPTPSIAQRLHYSDGSTSERPAGQYLFHATHMHYHAADLAEIELFRVIDPQNGTLAAAGIGNKQSYCLGDVRMVDFTRFDQGRAGSIATDCATPSGASMALTEGWVDIYQWSLPDNYLEFGDNPSGLYVIRATTDPSDFILESNEEDNVGYALVRVTGARVELLERGYGFSPWDPSHIRVGV